MKDGSRQRGQGRLAHPEDMTQSRKPWSWLSEEEGKDREREGRAQEGQRYAPGRRWSHMRVYRNGGT